ncbi:MAG: preprotein translocase subunit SecA [Sandaracinaceae bacterium]|nr:preprotein translocase subunit SecA [Sandaracinaceae bacterium]
MFDSILKKFMGTKHERELKRLRPMVNAINEVEDRYKNLDDAALQAKTAEFKQKLENGAPLADLIVPAFATAREASKRVLGMRHYDVQLIGGLNLHNGRIAEMKTGEGKTLMATLACYLNALEGKGVHVVTVNDYLAKRDAEWMGRLYGFLGMTTGTVVHSQRDADKKRAYRCDITYGQNNEFGFDYLRDNMKFSIFDYAQRELHYAIVDEVDSILIDEARTPLIISGPGETASAKYIAINEIIPRLRKDEHYTVDEKAHQVTLTEEGIERAQRVVFERGLTKMENLYDPVNLETLHILQQALRAHTLYKRDQNYMVTDDQKVMIIDEFTGRALPGRRWSDGLHQAVEAKENVPIQDENRTLATISFQNLFRLYKKLAGMTGTADTEAGEFHSIYKLDVSVIPTNKPIQRKDYEDLVYKTEREKFKAVVDEILDCRERGQPVLVGTTSVEKSDALHRMLDKSGVPHNVLNAKQHEREAYVVAQAGRKGAVTVATNMAGRGTDILLGGNAEMIARYEFMQTATEEQRANKDELERSIAESTERFRATCEAEKKEVIDAGGLHILGTERHESRRIDNQLRGRGGRQGDPGSSRFFLSLEDDLMRIFAGERIQVLMDRLGMEEGVPIEHPWVTKAVENAQTKVEERNFDSRKQLLEYDDVMNQQRKSIYALRRQVLEGLYRSMPTEEQAKKGAVPTRVVDTIDDSLAQKAKPILEEMVKLAAAPPPTDPSPDAMKSYRDNALNKTIPMLTSINPDILEQWVYREFGCRIPLHKFASDPKAALAHLENEVAMSLTEQRERLLDLADELVSVLVERACPQKKHFEDWDVAGLARAYDEQFGVPATGLDKINDVELMAQKLYTDVEAILSKREQEFGSLLFLRVFRNFYLQEIDRQWIDHLQNMEQLRDGIHLRGYGQRDPKKEYKKEGFDLFMQMAESVKSSVASNMFRFQLQREEDVERIEEQRRKAIEAQQKRIRASHVEAPTAGGESADNPKASLAPPPQPQGARRSGAPGSMSPQGRPQGSPSAPPKIETVRRDKPKVGRNDPCWCGSGKKYKQCHLAQDTESGNP